MSNPCAYYRVSDYRRPKERDDPPLCDRRNLIRTRRMWGTLPAVVKDATGVELNVTQLALTDRYRPEISLIIGDAVVFFEIR